MARLRQVRDRAGRISERARREFLFSLNRLTTRWQVDRGNLDRALARVRETADSVRHATADVHRTAEAQWRCHDQWRRLRDWLVQHAPDVGVVGARQQRRLPHARRRS